MILLIIIYLDLSDIVDILKFFVQIKYKKVVYLKLKIKRILFNGNLKE